MHIRRATYTDIDAMMQLFAHARAQMAKDGNPGQWGDGYPKREQIVADIEQGVGYIIEKERMICGTFVFVIGPDPTYQKIDDGQWIDENSPYGTIHRIASDGKQKGIFRHVLEWCTAQCGNIRIDTHHDNKRMIHLIEQAGFIRCGIIYTRNGSARIAYQRITK